MITPPPQALGQTSLSVFAGTWTGTSTCVGGRPACKNETVVYRFVPIEGHPKQLRLLADKIIEGKRIPMFALLFELNERTKMLESEFKIGRTHGVWSFAVKDETMTGSLITLPERAVGRDVMAHRVKDSELPAAPALKEYDE